MSKKNDISNQPALFDAEEMERITPSDQWKEQDKPVTCLGREFPNDEARREYFREELRRRLPELRKIEGFPIGADDDIIRLSDPPYYTACPNPWLNDFIAEWEKEKKQLEREGKRKADFEVKEPYASDVTGIKNDSIYRSLFYHTKVPQSIIIKYLHHYTQPGDIVFDGFSGSGMTGLACQSCREPFLDINDSNENNDAQYGERHAVCIDLSPFASLLGHSLNTPKHIGFIQHEINRIYAELVEEYGWMYKTKHSNGELGEINSAIYSDIVGCCNCGHELNFWHQVVKKNAGVLLDDYLCPYCGAKNTLRTPLFILESFYDSDINEVVNRKKSVLTRIAYTYKGVRYEKEADSYDLDVIERINNFKIHTWFPIKRMAEGGETRRNDKYGITHTHHFFSKRNLILLSAFYDKINKSTIANELRYIFAGMIMRSSKLNKVHFTKYLKGRTDWDAGYLKGTLYIPPFSVESSSLFQIQNKIKRYVKAGSYFPLKYDNCVVLGSAVSTGIKDDSIDYIFVDPPFGSNIAYSELNFLIEAWFNLFTENTTEAIQNEFSDKSLSKYSELMYSCFKEFFRILKPGKWMTIEFSNTSDSVWNAIQNAVRKTGFVVANVSVLNKGQGGMRAVTTTTAVKQDLAISCYKPKIILDRYIKEGIRNTDFMWSFVEEYLNHLDVYSLKDNKTEFIKEREQRIVFDKTISYYVQHGLPVPMDAHEFQAGLRDRFVERDGMFFTAAQAVEYEEKRKHSDGFAPMGIIVSDEANGIEWLKNQLRESPKTYQQIQPEWMQAINGLRKGDILPELKTLLEENFIEMEDGRWRLPNIQDDIDKNQLRTKALLKEFNLYKEQALKPKAKLKEVRVEALRAGFKQCYIDKDFQTIVTIGDKIPQNLRDEDEVLLQFYDIAMNKL